MNMAANSPGGEDTVFDFGAILENGAGAVIEKKRTELDLLEDLLQEARTAADESGTKLLMCVGGNGRSACSVGCTCRCHVSLLGVYVPSGRWVAVAPATNV